MRAPLGFIQLLVMGLLLQTEGASAQRLEIEPNDTLKITGTVDEETSSFSRNLRLTAIGRNAAELLFWASDLQHLGDPTLRLDGSNVRIPSGVSLTERVPQDIRVTFDLALDDTRRPSAFHHRIARTHDRAEAAGHSDSLDS